MSDPVVFKLQVTDGPVEEFQIRIILDDDVDDRPKYLRVQLLYEGSIELDIPVTTGGLMFRDVQTFFTRLQEYQELYPTIKAQVTEGS